jgi:hypothetical protein
MMVSSRRDHCLKDEPSVIERAIIYDRRAGDARYIPFRARFRQAMTRSGSITHRRNLRRRELGKEFICKVQLDG